MQRSGRHFEIIQILRSSNRPVTAEGLAARLEVSTRTIYRDLAALQAMRVPIVGEAGIGYVMRAGYDLPPVNFDREEVEALRVGLSMLARTGDSTLQRAAQRIRDKIDALHEPIDWLQVAPWGAPADDPSLGCVSIGSLRAAIRDTRKLRLIYRDGKERETERVVRPVGLIYHVDCTMLAAWCELREGFRHFRTDRVFACDELPETFSAQGEALRLLWLENNRWPEGAA